ncbi:IS1595 family transposase [Paucibacter sp. B51]|uniref:IS1595 family transposase n=1 Tax=Paucibacter sp. B51 TaxID=2993315 RepID=UPI0022EBEA9C|nr:IS1595 family transposase [Paucibacter sp. B51]
MPINRIQFQPGLSLATFFQRYGTLARCQQALYETRWPRGFVCPKCASTEHSRHERGTRLLLQCCRCRRQTSLTAGTVFDASKLPLTTWFLAIHLLTQSKTGMSALQLMRDLGVSYRSAWLVKHKLMQVMFGQERERKLETLVQIDDVFVGGERQGCGRGRTAPNKVLVVAAVQTTSNGKAVLTRLDVVPNWQKLTIARWASKALAAGTHVVSDGLSTFAAVKGAGFTHEPIIVNSTGKAAGQHPRFLAVNTTLGNLKTWMASTFKGFKLSHYTQRYLAEFQYRFNRRFDLRAILTGLLVDAIHCNPWREVSLRKRMPAEICA